MRRFSIIVIFSLATLAVWGQGQPSFKYRRAVTGVSNEGWYSITLPSDLFSRCQTSLSDLRLYSIMEDTLEIPYLLRVNEPQTQSEAYNLAVMNESSRNNIQYITFINSGKTINQIELQFGEDNYFATVALEGSYNNKEWFEIVNNQRIFSIENAFESYRYSEVHFPAANFAYLRVAVSADRKLNFKNASFEKSETKPGVSRTIPNHFNVSHDKKNKRTIVDVRFDYYQPINGLSVDIASGKDYYRSAQVDILTDSFKTEKGWIKNYSPIHNGYLTSIHPNQITTPLSFTSAIRLTINNLDNTPLDIRNISAKGPVVELISQLPFQQVALFYGDELANKPAYDIEHFQKNVPVTLAAASLGPEEVLVVTPAKVSYFLENKNLLYVVMLVIIGVLGFFTLRMMKTKTSPQ